MPMHTSQSTSETATPFRLEILEHAQHFSSDDKATPVLVEGYGVCRGLRGNPDESRVAVHAEQGLIKVGTE
ncbi:hypothetical protein NSK_000242 [Nannochloropsis salina CCMP1776]|uniref:Uncharacterized protein n=1 Tax=Nannochloropsis salina CCMP1776 TaxID=1027361 RepID=A0A4D9DES5_9STRA|nr:hypothetical protein NSK_000242 [Nannochloropsis salina CCMP1776]|eukprot:TFJ88673.1 hypothetical protein NSK_000242 [Nannochloropsis salina CCMP1776]